MQVVLCIIFCIICSFVFRDTYISVALIIVLHLLLPQRKKLFRALVSDASTRFLSSCCNACRDFVYSLIILRTFSLVSLKLWHFSTGLFISIFMYTLMCMLASHSLESGGCGLIHSITISRRSSLS